MAENGEQQEPVILRRNDTMEMLSQMKGSDELSAHEQPKLKSFTGQGAQKEGNYSKTVEVLGEADLRYFPCQLSDYMDVEQIPSPMSKSGLAENMFVSNSETILLDIVTHKKHETVSREFVRGGPRKLICHDPKNIKAAIVTCGGLCPGLNTVIREIYTSLKNSYGVPKVYGVPYGYCGFYSPQYEIRELTDADVDDIHHEGGTILGSSRGGHSTKMIVDAIIDFGFKMVFVIGGDGSHAGAVKLYEEMRKRKLPIAIVGVPKTIDNDIALIDHSFGFSTAVEEAQLAIRSARNEAISAFNGIGLVKLMGRHSGHIAMQATLASRDVDICLIPEVPCAIEGPKGVLAHIKHVLERKGYCTIVVAEGAGVNLASGDTTLEKDASGNVKLPDIGIYLKNKITKTLTAMGVENTLKYIDPTYMIRTVPPNAADNLYCAMLAQNAVHGAFAGYTGFTVGLVRTHYVYIPMQSITGGRIEVDVESHSWKEVMSVTHQPNFEG